MEHIIATVKDTILQYKMINCGELVVAGVSGGPDSLAMLHILKGLQADLNFKLQVAHVDHSFRGKEAEDEAAWVKMIAEKWELPCTVAKIDVPQIAREKGLSFEEAGHYVRKEFFLKLAKDRGAKKIALGHQADDQAETLMMHFLVGTGLGGLQGITPLNFPFVRPLIFVKREDIEKYCQDNHLEPRRDSSNEENIYLRNKVRNQVLPWLRENINPNLTNTLNRTALIMQEEEDFIQKEMEKLAAKIVLVEKAKTSLYLKEWNRIHICLARRLVRFAYKTLCDKQGISFSHVEKIRHLAEGGQVGKILQLPGGILVEKGYKEVVFYHKGSAINEIARLRKGIKKQAIKIPGTTFIPETGQSIFAQIIEEVVEEKKEIQILLPWEKELPKIYVRSRMSGDRFSPLGMKGTKKLKDLMLEKRIPQKERDHTLLITTEDEVIWIPGVAVSKKCNNKSKEGRYLAITLVD